MVKSDLTGGQAMPTRIPYFVSGHPLLAAVG
jgi:hypothetical protein